MNEIGIKTYLKKLRIKIESINITYIIQLLKQIDSHI